MDKKILIGLVIGLVIGVAIGFFVCGKGGQGSGGTRGEWPMVPCPPENVQGQMALDVCDQIVSLAMQAMPPSPESQECAAKAQQVKSANPPDVILAANTLNGALQAAQAGDWVACKRELDQID